jgi:spermidine/putrescine transport system substrate-binding protein
MSDRELTPEDEFEHEEVPAGAGLAAYSRGQFLARSGGLVAGLTTVSALSSAVKAASAAVSASSTALGGTIRFVNYTGWIGKGEYAAFKKRSGLSIHEIPVNTGRSQHVAADPSSADMILDPVGAGLGILNAAGLLLPLDLRKIPNYRLIAHAFKRDVASPAVHKAIPTDFGRTGILIRTDIVKDPIRSWKDFFRLIPKYPGKAVLLDEVNESLRNAILSLAYKGNTTNTSEVNKGADLLISVKKDIASLVTANAGKMILQGAAAFGMLEDWEGNQTITENPKAPLKWIDPIEGAAGYLDAIAAIKGTKMLPEIEEFLNFHLMPKIAANFSNTLSSAPVEPAAAKYVNKKVVRSKITYPPQRVLEKIVYWGYLGDAQRAWDDAWARFKAA